jgi:hypothetical protein
VRSVLPRRGLAESARDVANAAYYASRGTTAAIATLLSGVVVGFVGFLRYAMPVASANNTLMLGLAGRPAGAGGEDLSVSAPVALTMLSSITFALATPMGWLATYLGVTGLVRGLAAAVGERRGDPIVGLVRRFIAGMQTRRRAAREAAGFVTLSGPEVPDRVFTGERFGIVGADLIVVASRPKPEWTPGTVLECGGRWLRVGEAIQRSLPVGLRTVYPLVNMPDTAVFRRIVRYELPRRLGSTGGP